MSAGLQPGTYTPVRDADTKNGQTDTHIPAKVANSDPAPGRIGINPGEVIHPEGCYSAGRTDPVSPSSAEESEVRM